MDLERNEVTLKINQVRPQLANFCWPKVIRSEKAAAICPRAFANCPIVVCCWGKSVITGNNNNKREILGLFALNAERLI